MAATCPQCGHPPEVHWPEGDYNGSACSTCIKPPQFYTFRLDNGATNMGRPAMCCYPARDIRAA